MKIIGRLNDNDVMLYMAKILKPEIDSKTIKSYKPNTDFSEGEDLTEDDLDLISNRTKNIVTEGLEWTESYYKDMGGALLQWNPEASINAFELQYDPEATFKIGDNNIKGGI